MNILIIGSGAREHALGYFLAKDTRVQKLWFAPGNAGTSELGENLLLGTTDIARLVEWAQENKPDLTVVGPEASLCLGIVDRFQEKGFKIFGPNQAAAQLEGSKIFTKELLQAASIPTAHSESFANPQEAYDYLKTVGYPIVIKADGLAAGKGVVIAHTSSEASEAIKQMMEQKCFGQAGSRILVEEFLEGEELSVHAITDGKTYQLLPASQDHKRIFEDDQGPNTGGVGAYAPAPLGTPALLNQVCESILNPFFEILRERNIFFQGVLYAGLMITTQGPKVLEFNVRFGDPETEVMLPLLKTPLLDILLAIVDCKLSNLTFQFHSGAALAVVLTASGYPEQPKLGDEIFGLQNVQEGYIFHAGTRCQGDKIYTSGGRVLCVAGQGKTLREAANVAYQLAYAIQFEGKHFRRDIGSKAFMRLEKTTCETF